jgi:LytS/YehU family sensor histidine kinase
MIDSGVFAMDSIFNDVCVLVTIAFALTLAPGFNRAGLSFLSRRDQATALLVFTILGLIEEGTVSQAGWLNERIVAVCAAGLVAGPLVGLAVSVFVTWIAVAHHGLPLGSIATSMLCGGLAGGWLYRWRPKLAQQPITGFCLTLGVSWLRSGLLFLWAPFSRAAPHWLEEIGMAPVLQGLGTGLVLAVVEQVRDRDEPTRAAASAEIRAASAHEPTFSVQCSKCVSGAVNGRATRSTSGHSTVAPISTGQFQPTGASTRTPGGRAGISTCLFRHRVATIR